MEPGKTVCLKCVPRDQISVHTSSGHLECEIGICGY